MITDWNQQKEETLRKILKDSHPDPGPTPKAWQQKIMTHIGSTTVAQAKGWHWVRWFVLSMVVMVCLFMWFQLHAPPITTDQENDLVLLDSWLAQAAETWSEEMRQSDDSDETTEWLELADAVVAENTTSPAHEGP